MAAPGFTVRFVRLQSQNGTWLVHPELRSRIVEDAEREGISLIDQCVKIIGAKYGVPFAPTLRKTTPAPDGKELNLSLPDRLDAKLNRAAKNPPTRADLMRAALSEHYDLPLPPKASRRRAAA